MHRFTMVATATFLGLATLAGCSSSSSDTAATTGGGVTVPAGDGTPVAVTVGETSDTVMYMKVAPDSVKAGKVTFTLKNEGKKTHEMVVLKTDTPYDQLEVGSNNKVSEDASVGEVSEIKAGETGTVTLDLATGAYALVCNVEKHYAMGMRAPFTVTP